MHGHIASTVLSHEGKKTSSMGTQSLSWSLKCDFCIFSERWICRSHWSRRTFCCWCDIPACCSIERYPDPRCRLCPCSGHASWRRGAQHVGHTAGPPGCPGPRCPAGGVSSLLSHGSTSHPSKDWGPFTRAETTRLFITSWLGVSGRLLCLGPREVWKDCLFYVNLKGNLNQCYLILWLEMSSLIPRMWLL